MIDEEATFEQFGYHSYNLKPKSGKKIFAVCDGCGKVRILSKSAYHALCQSCASAKGENSPHWKGGKVKRICETCGKEFLVKPSETKRGYGKFCSRKCMSEFFSINYVGENHSHWKGGNVKRICETCGREFFVKPYQAKIDSSSRFCSQKCMGIWFSEYRRGKNHPGWRGGKAKRICETCGKEFEIFPAEIKNGGGRFCSLGCHGKWRSKHFRGENNPTWKGGRSRYCYKWNEPFREYIRDKFGRVCFLCPKTEAENGKHLSVHHVNGNKNCGCDEDATCQFVPLCVSCHGKMLSKKVDWEKKIKDMMHNKLNGWVI